MDPMQARGRSLTARHKFVETCGSAKLVIMLISRTTRNLYYMVEVLNMFRIYKNNIANGGFEGMKSATKHAADSP